MKLFSAGFSSRIILFPPIDWQLKSDISSLFVKKANLLSPQMFTFLAIFTFPHCYDYVLPSSIVNMVRTRALKIFTYCWTTVERFWRKSKLPESSLIFYQWFKNILEKFCARGIKVNLLTGSMLQSFITWWQEVMPQSFAKVVFRPNKTTKCRNMKVSVIVHYFAKTGKISLEQFSCKSHLCKFGLSNVVDFSVAHD